MVYFLTEKLHLVKSNSHWHAFQYSCQIDWALMLLIPLRIGSCRWDSPLAELLWQSECSSGLAIALPHSRMTRSWVSCQQQQQQHPALRMDHLHTYPACCMRCLVPNLSCAAQALIRLPVSAHKTIQLHSLGMKFIMCKETPLSSIASLRIHNCCRLSERLDLHFETKVGILS